MPLAFTEEDFLVFHMHASQQRATAHLIYHFNSSLLVCLNKTCIQFSDKHEWIKVRPLTYVVVPAWQHPTSAQGIEDSPHGIRSPAGTKHESPIKSYPVVELIRHQTINVPRSLLGGVPQSVVPGPFGWWGGEGGESLDGT